MFEKFRIHRGFVLRFLFFFLKLTPKYLREKVTVIYTNHSYVWQGKWDDIKDVIKKRYFQETFCCRHADKVFVLKDKTMLETTLARTTKSGDLILFANDAPNFI